MERAKAEYLRRLNHLFANYRSNCRVQRCALDFNSSLAAGVRALNPRSKGKPPRARVNPELELLINVRANELAKARGTNSGGLNSADVNTASGEVLAKLKPRRGRPANPILTYHVHGYMLLHRETCGSELRAAGTRNGDYNPHIKSPMQDLLLRWFREADPRVTLSAIVEVIEAARRSRVLEGKRFADLFPFYGGRVDPETGYPVPGPGFRLEHFVPITPIYSS